MDDDHLWPGKHGVLCALAERLKTTEDGPVSRGSPFNHFHFRVLKLTNDVLHQVTALLSNYSDDAFDPWDSVRREEENQVLWSRAEV